MTEQKSPFSCCTQSKIAIFLCPHCRDLAAYCQICHALFRNLQDTNSALFLKSGATITCQQCQHTYNGPEGWRKHLATQRDLVAAGFSSLAHCKDIELKAGPPEEAPKENYRHMVDRIGWDGSASSSRATAASFPDTSPKGSNVRVLMIFLLMVSLIAGIYYSYDYFFPAPPPPPPAKAPPVKK